MESVAKIIGRHQYGNLLKKKNNTLEELEKVKAYEESKRMHIDDNEFIKEYKRKLKEPPRNEVVKPTYGQLYLAFLESFKSMYRKPFIEDENSIAALKTVVYFFLEDLRFFNSPILSTLSDPSFEKGLLIVGSYGCGKTSMMLAICEALKKFRYKPFRSLNAHDVVQMYEACTDQQHRNSFWLSMNRKAMLFDDLKAEREASNFGKANLFKQVIESRYTKDLVTHGTCNFDSNHPGELNKAVEEFGKMYGNRVYDRAFEMWNVIEFKGKSKRK